MQTTSLTLSTLQQRWLSELQVAGPFIAPYKAKVVSTTAPQQNKTVAPVEIKTAEPMISARQALNDSLAALRPDSTPAAQAKSTVPAVTPPATAPKPVVRYVASDLQRLDLSALQHFADQCQACELHEQRAQAVVGAGQTQQPDWMVISTAPSSNEEMAGLPMQGKSGELFAAQMQSIGIDQAAQLYVTQLLKCRSATKPQAEHIAACQQILWRQIDLIQPRRLLLLGAKAATLFLGDQVPFEALRGQVHQWRNPSNDQPLPVVVSYHPASILLRPQLKAQSWGDLLLCRQLQHE